MNQSQIVWSSFGWVASLALVGACAHGNDSATVGGSGPGGSGGASTTGTSSATGAATGTSSSTGVSTGTSSATATSSTGATGGAGTSSTSASSATSAGSTSASSSASSAGSTSASGSGGDAGAGDGGDLDAGGADGSSDAGSGTIAYSDDFEADVLGAQATGWTRIGGSSGDWVVVTDTTQVFAQSHSTSSTLRVCRAGPVLTTAATVSAQVKITTTGSSGVTTAMVCVRYPAGGGTPYACVALEASVGVQIKTGGVNGPVWPATVSIGTWYDVKLAVDASGALTAYLDGALLGTFTPTTAIAGGSVAIATQSAEAEFDNVVLTTP